jgi:hypothetical protein
MEWCLTREGLYKALAKDGNPRFGTVLKVINALGMKLMPAWPENWRSNRNPSQLRGYVQVQARTGQVIESWRAQCLRHVQAHGHHRQPQPKTQAD